MESVTLTYGTFDLFHIGHLNLLERAASLGLPLYVGVSTEMFNAAKGKESVVPFEERCRIVKALKCVKEVFPEDSWIQKAEDIQRFSAKILVMGSDWEGKFDTYLSLCSVKYFPRTEAVSTTEIRRRTASLYRGPGVS